jgi:hypothetical protein
VGVWKEFDSPQEWRVSQDSQLVNLGSGRFVIARFFHTQNPMYVFGDEINNENFVVLTGAEVCGKPMMTMVLATVAMGKNWNLESIHTNRGITHLRARTTVVYLPSM